VTWACTEVRGTKIYEFGGSNWGKGKVRRLRRGSREG
jgi:hypothetical protein